MALGCRSTMRLELMKRYHNLTCVVPWRPPHHQVKFGQCSAPPFDCCTTLGGGPSGSTGAAWCGWCRVGPASGSVKVSLVRAGGVVGQAVVSSIGWSCCCVSRLLFVNVGPMGVASESWTASGVAVSDGAGGPVWHAWGTPGSSVVITKGFHWAASLGALLGCANMFNP